MSPLRFLSTVAFVLVVAGPVATFAAQDPSADETTARAYAAPRVFVVRTNKEVGTAVLLKVDGTVGYFATCYHVLHNANEFTIYPSDGSGDKVADSQNAHVVTRRSLDLTLIKTALPDHGGFKPLNAMQENGLVSEDDRYPIDGFVFGMAGFQIRQLFTTSVRIQQIEWADLLNGVIDRDLLKLGEPRLQIRFLGREITYGGMSGGLVVDREQRFAGLLLGRMPEPNAIPMMITARQVKESLDESDRTGWAVFTPKEFADPPPYKAAVLKQMLEPFPISEIAWNSYDAWVKAFEAEPLQFLKAFQEVRLDLRVLESFTRDPKNRGSNRFQVELNGEQDARFLLNGVPWKQREPIPLQKGENLLIISKPPSGAARFDLTDFLQPNPIDITFRLGDPAETVYILRRSLPRVIQGYSIYVTIQNGLPDPGSNYVGRLAVALDYVEELISKTPFRLPFRGGDLRSGSEVRGVALFGNKPAKLSFVSPQTLDISADIQIEVGKVQANFAGIRLTGKPRTMPITMTGRVQFPASPHSLFLVCARAMAAAGPEKQFIVPLVGDELTVDASGLLRELLVCYANTRLLRPDNPRIPGPGDIQRFLQTGGLASEKTDWQFAPVGIQLVPDDRQAGTGKAWVVITFQLLHKGEPIEIRQPPPLLPDRGVRDKLAAEFLTAAMPAAGAAALHASVMEQTGLYRGLNAGTEGVGPFALRLALSRIELDRQEEVLLSEDAAELADKLGKVAMAGLSRSKVTGEVRWGTWQSPGRFDVKGVCLATTFTPAAVGVRQFQGIISSERAEVKTDIGDIVLCNVKGAFQLTTDPKNEEKTYHFKITTSEGKYDLGSGKPQDLPKFEFDVWISRDGETVKHNFGDQFLFGRKGN